MDIMPLRFTWTSYVLFPTFNNIWNQGRWDS